MYYQIRISSLRRQGFSEAQASLNKKHLQLLRDVVTRWSSTYLMIERTLELREVDVSHIGDCQELMIVASLLNYFSRQATSKSYARNTPSETLNGKHWKCSRPFLRYAYIQPILLSIDSDLTTSRYRMHFSKFFQWRLLHRYAMLFRLSRPCRSFGELTRSRSPMLAPSFRLASIS